MKEQEGAHHHTGPPERAQPQEPHRYRVDHYGKSRNFVAYEGHTIIAVTLYRKGAAEIIARLEEKDGRIAALESQLATLAESQVFPPSSAEPVFVPALLVIGDDLLTEGALHPSIVTQATRVQSPQGV
jgi:hypothetical protein